ncbi:MAG: hypothetical protein HQM14_19130 [SAR324 cluster bacterium]|nr:hypothetical protein [SAR324 cluster bacterium]
MKKRNPKNQIFQEIFLILTISILLISCTSELKLSVEEKVWVGQDIKCSITGTWQNISWYINNQRVGKCEGQTACHIPATSTGEFKIRVEVKNGYKSAFEPAFEDKKEKKINIAKTDSDLIGKWGIKEDYIKNSDMNAFVDSLPNIISSDPTYGEKLQITRDEYILSKTILGVSGEKRFTADQDSGNELTIYFNGNFIREEIYLLNGDTLTLEHKNSSGGLVKKVYEKLY